MSAIVIEAQPGRGKMSRGVSDRLMAFVAPIGVLVLWEVLARLHLIDIRFFPAPSNIFGTFEKLIANGTLLANTTISLERVFFGFLLGAIPALAIGLIMGLYRPIRVIVEPLIMATYPIPKSAILPLILLIFGLGEMSKIVMVAIGVFYPVVINTAAGVMQIPALYLDVGKNFGASRWQTFRTIAFPGALPFIMTGVKLGAGLGLVLIAVAEMIGAQSGLGFMIWDAWQILSVNTMYVGLITIAILGFVITIGLDELERVLIPHRQDR